MYCLPGNIRIMGLIPAHPRFTRMYGVTNSVAFQAISNLRNLDDLSDSCRSLVFVRLISDKSDKSVSLILFLKKLSFECLCLKNFVYICICKKEQEEIS